MGDLVERAFKRRPRDPLAAVLPVDEELRAAVADVKARLTAALGAPPDNERLQRVTSPAG